MKSKQFAAEDAYLATAIALYSTGHWIGGTVALILAVSIIAGARV